MRPIHIAFFLIPMLLATTVQAGDLQDRIAASLRGNAGIFRRPGHATTITPQIFADRIAAAVGSPFGMPEQQEFFTTTLKSETDFQTRIIASFSGKHI